MGVAADGHAERDEARVAVSGAKTGGQLIGGPQARVPIYVPYADFFQYQAGAGRLADRA